ncbi:MAG: phosphotransferase family protein [Dehalococcoidia bacterium]|nr:phosphotransferase family protein [Dehalococcoidia bacterium]
MADGDADGLIDVPALERYLAERVPGDDAPLECERHVVGSSNVTYYVTRGSQEWVLRRPPPGPLLPTAHDVLREHRFIAALQGEARVPEPVVACDDDSIIGAPFYLMERCFGAMLRDGIPEAYDNPTGRRRIAEDLVATLVELHGVDWEAVGLRGRASGYLERQMRRWIGQWELTRPQTRDLPGLDEIVEWLKARMPGDAGATVVHGDYRLDNVMYAAEEPSVVAIFDWEMATVGDPLADVGWLLSYWGDPGDPPPPPGWDPPTLLTAQEGFPDHEEVIALYEEGSGRSMQHVAFYHVFAVFKLAIILEGLYMQHLQETAANPDSARFEWFVPVLVDRAQRLMAAAGG